MNNLPRIQKVSRLFCSFLIIPLLTLPFFEAYVWTFYTPDNFILQALTPPQALPLQTRFLAFLASMLPIAVKMYALHILRKLFNLYTQGKIFHLKNVLCFRKLAFSLILLIPVSIISETLVHLILTWQNPPGERLLHISVESKSFTVLIIGCVIWLISWVMEEGRILEEEQAHTI